MAWNSTISEEYIHDHVTYLFGYLHLHAIDFKIFLMTAIHVSLNSSSSTWRIWRLWAQLIPLELSRSVDHNQALLSPSYCIKWLEKPTNIFQTFFYIPYIKSDYFTQWNEFEDTKKSRVKNNLDFLSFFHLFLDLFTSKVSKMIIWEIQYFGVQAQSRARQPKAKSHFCV